MKAQILHIGIIDKEGRVHAVNFKEGVNVITGRSSTGKSALIEIFDYCFGSSDFTVPVGVITECTSIYFTVLKVKESLLVLARRSTDTKAFLKEETDLNKLETIDKLSITYFEDDYFYPLTDFKKELRLYFNILITDIDEDEITRDRRGRKSATPSVRSLTSYMLQHQNLIANKHALFYRFDQKEKRDQTIDHLKVFLNFADQHYFIKAQELNTLEQRKRQLERALPKRIDSIKAAQIRLENELNNYEAISGTSIGFLPSEAVSRPKAILNKLRQTKVTYKSDSDSHVKLRQGAVERQRELISSLRIKQQELADINSSIKFSERYAEARSETVVPEDAELHAESCPFCSSETNEIENYANELTDAIHWLNTELSHSSYRLASFEEAKKKKLKEISSIKEGLEQCNKQIQSIDKQIKDLAKVRSQFELTVEAKLRVENVISDIAKFKADKSDSEILSLQKQITTLKKDLADNYDIAKKLNQAEKKINSFLGEYGQLFEFEESYAPIQLKFSLESFDLWHEDTNKKQVFLRSMGSGANWLSCHLVLFLALQRYFCEVGDACSIPPILFFDQPSQVYFPSILDGAEEFSAKDLVEKDKSRGGSRTVDEDIRAVTNLFTQLVSYCHETAETTGIMPQIIVTDHADHLQLPNGLEFESFVRERWRKKDEGFISKQP